MRQAWGNTPERSLLKPFAAALEDDRRAGVLATFHPFATFPPFFALVPYYKWLGLSEVQKLLVFGMSFQTKFDCNQAN